VGPSFVIILCSRIIAVVITGRYIHVANTVYATVISLLRPTLSNALQLCMK